MAKGPKRRIVEGALNFAADVIPDVVEGPLRRFLGVERKAAPSFAVPRGRLALPAPPKRLALPAPGPGLPPQAAKPRGGQWWIDKELEYGNTSPENAAREGALGMGIKTMQWQPDPDYGVIDLNDPAARLLRAFEAPMVPKADKSPEQQWLERALTKYYKNDFGSPDDPLRGLAERGLHYDPEMTPEKWKATVDSYLMEDSIGDITVPQMLYNSGAYPGAGDDFTTEARMAMPWLGKLPVTDKLYGISGGGLDLGHFTDEFYNALNPEISGLPMDLAVRPESLDRMTFAQAAEHVGKINQYRAKEMERAALAASDSPAISLFKEYPENNPMGLRWVELKAPELSDDLLDDFDSSLVDLAVKEGRTIDPAHMDEVRRARASRVLEDALRYEGDTMGHCVGGYCPDVMSGRSRIFSLRDAKGEPHVTVETSPSKKQYFFSDVRNAVGQDQADAWLNEGVHLSDMVDRAGLNKNQAPEDIIQIKGKQNRAPKDDYLPFVQDFVKSQQWGNVGDLSNTGLVRLPDGRYLTHDQMDEIIRNEGLDDRYQSYDFNARQFPRDPAYMDPEDWAQFQHYFEGYAIGGRVDADRCFCHNPLSVRRGR